MYFESASLEIAFEPVTFTVKTRQEVIVGLYNYSKCIVIKVVPSVFMVNLISVLTCPVPPNARNYATATVNANTFHFMSTTMEGRLAL